MIRVSHLPADALGLAPWAARALAGRPRPRGLPGMIVPSELDHVPREPHPLEPEEREELTDRLERAVSRFEPHVAVLESVRALRDPEACLVVAGQQPGFLGGPLFDVYKALSAVRLARALTRAWQRPVVPAFWNHADDHDVAEVHHVWIQNPDLDLRKVVLAGVSSGRTPLSALVFSSERHGLAALAELLRQNLWECEAREPALELFLPKEGESFSNAFTRVLVALFGPHGLVPIEPDWIREPLSRSLSRVVASGVGAGLAAGAEALATAGTEAVIDASGAALLFHHEEGQRRALRLADGEFRYDGEAGSRTGTELAAEIVDEPGPWSAGALLRPIVQDLTLPVVAYVGGFGELAYHAQLPPLRERAGAPITAFVPRLSATLVDPQTASSLEKLGLTVGQALSARGRLGEDPEASGEGPPVARHLREIGGEAARRLRDARASLAELDPGLAQQLKKAADQVRRTVDKLAGKAERVHANARGSGRRHVRRVNNALFPRETPQERVRGVLEIAARYGTEWIDELAGEIEPLPTEHLVVHLTEPRPAPGSGPEESP